ncbi:MAG: hydrogenase large subunit [Thermoleophilia bacterium]
MSHRDAAGMQRDRRQEVVTTATVDADSWRSEVSSLLGDGNRFLSLYGLRGVPLPGDATAPHSADAATHGHVRALFAGAEGLRLLTCLPSQEGTPSLVDLIPAAAWDEREAHDAYGVPFPGHEPMRPLLHHDLDLASWTVPVRGHDPFQVAVGPIHAGVIESGHFRFHVVGERILHLDVRLFYKHRGLELAAEGRTPVEALRHVQWACAACAVSNSVAFAHAYESASGLWPTPELARARTLLLELERLYNHLNDIGAACAGVGFALGSMAFAALKERAHRLNAQLTGHRFLFDTISLGESRMDVSAAAADRARQELLDLGVDARKAWHEVIFNGSVQDRFVGVGLLTKADTRRMGAVGPAARAAGSDSDARTRSPRLAYWGFVPAALRRPEGDVASRVNMRALEVDVTLSLLDELLSSAIRPAGSIQTATAGPAPGPVDVGMVESPRGETVCVAEIDGGRVKRVHLRTGSYANWPALAHATVGSLLPDFPLINKSFELCYSCSDR